MPERTPESTPDPSRTTTGQRAASSVAPGKVPRTARLARGGGAQAPAPAASGAAPVQMRQASGGNVPLFGVQLREEGSQEGQEDRDLSRGREVLGKLRSGAFVSSIEVGSVLRALVERTDAPAVELAAELRQAAIDADYWLGVVSRELALIDSYKNGTDNPDSYITHLSIAQTRGWIASDVRLSGDPRLEQLDRDLETLSDFYIRVSVYTTDLPRYQSQVRQLQAFINAGTPLDWQMLNDVRLWLPDIFDHVLHPYLGDPVLQNSATLGRYSEMYGEWVALQTQLESMPGGQYEQDGRFMAKAELEALPEATPEYPAQDSRQTREDVNQAMARAQEILDNRPGMSCTPGDVYTTITRLRMMRSHVTFSSDQERIDQLITRLEARFEEMEDSEFAGEQNPENGLSFQVDLTQPFSVSALATILNTIANEPGESGSVTFRVEGEARIGSNPIVNAYVGGWGQLRLAYGVTDTLTCALGFDASAAIRAGVSLARVASAGVQFGAGYNVTARFANPSEVATWLFQQLDSINQLAGVAVFPTIGGSDLPEVNPAVVHEGRGFGGLEASVDVGPVAGNVEWMETGRQATYSRGGEEVTQDGAAVVGETRESSFTIGGVARVNDALSFTGSYTFTAQNVARDMNSANEGEYHNHRLIAGFDLTRAIQRWTDTSRREVLPANELQDAVLNLFAQFESHMPAGLPMDVLHGTFDQVVAKIYEGMDVGRKANAGFSGRAIFEWNSVKEAEDYRNQYFRLSVSGAISGSLGGSTMAGGLQGSLTAEKSEVLYESIGSDTYSYVLQRYIFAWDRQQWLDFAREHQQAIEELMRNMSSTEHRLHDAGFAQALAATGYPGAGYDAGLRALEQFFERSRDSIMREDRD